MSILSLILRNLKYYRKPYLAILAGTVISTAVLTGALVVGDSVQYSLGQLTEIRLGKTRFAIQSGDRFFRQKLANDLSDRILNPVAPLLQLEGLAINNDQNSRINRVEVLGIDDRFVKLWGTSALQPTDDEAFLSQNTAEKLKLKPGDTFLLKIRKQAKASENAPFIAEKEPLITFRLKVASVVEDRQMGRFSLKSNQSAPFNIFIALSTLSRKIELEGYANLMLIAENGNENLNPQKVDSALRLCWKPEDTGLKFRNLPGTNINEIRSERIFIDDPTAKAIKSANPEAEPIFTYLVNDISLHGKSTPYSFITAADFPDLKLSDHEIVISNWLATDLDVKPGDSFGLKYFKMGILRKLTEDSARFVVKFILPITDPKFDRTLMPDFPGMTDAGNCRDWETGAPVNLDKIRDKDEQYWKDFRGTPKAFISLAAGQKLWDNAFGHATSFRFASDSNELVTFKSDLMKSLNPAENGLAVKDIYSEGKSAAANSTDFGGLFLSLSFFIIVAALLLTALLFSLHAQKRMAETAILASIGFRKREIIRIMFLEASLVVLIGSILGVICGIFYNKLLLLGLNTLWQDAVRTSMLQMHVVPGTLVIGFATGVFAALLSILYVLLRNLRKPLSAIVKGIEIPSIQVNRKRKNSSLIIAIFFFGVAIILMAYSFLSPQNDPSEIFLSSGGMILVAGLAFLNFLLLHANQKTTTAFPDFYVMMLRNISLKKRRTLAAIALLAIGTFSVIITGANRKTFFGTENAPQSGTGGYLFWAESTVPILKNLNSPDGKEKYGLTDEKALQNVNFIQMLSLDGNDASCLNLNQVAQPKILGIIPQYFDQKHSFSFVDLETSINALHPWKALDKPIAAGIIPAFADQTVIQWGLRKKVGDTLMYRDEFGKILKVKLMGGLDNSVFQGNILVSAELFRKYFPSVGGTKVMLVDGDFAKRSAISERLEYLFQDYGMVVTPASERLAQFNSVENTYLSVFMILGGLGILIGTFGLGIILLRNLDERKQEFALYQAIGINRNAILRLIFTENLFILLAGMGIGLISAFAGILPSFFSPAFQLPTMFLVVILFLVLLSGVSWIYFPIRSSLHKNHFITLQKE